MKINSVLKTTILATAVIMSTTAFSQDNSANLILADKGQLHDNSAATTDAGITTAIKAAFVKEKLFGDADVSAMSISVETENGVVHLTGTADNQTQIDNAVKISEGANGVKKVINDVTIKPKE